MTPAQLADDNSQNQPALREDKSYPPIATCKRWIKQHNQLGHICPKQATCNNNAGRRDVQCEKLVQPALFQLIKPKSKLN